MPARDRRETRARRRPRNARDPRSGPTAGAAGERDCASSRDSARKSSPISRAPKSIGAPHSRSRPTDADALAALVRLQRKREDWHALRQTFETALGAAGQSALRTRCATSSASCCSNTSTTPRRARTCFERALASDAHDRTALAGLRRVAERSEDTDLLLQVCEREAAACDDVDELAEIARRARSPCSRTAATCRAPMPGPCGRRSRARLPGAARDARGARGPPRPPGRGDRLAGSPRRTALGQRAQSLPAPPRRSAARAGRTRGRRRDPRSRARERTRSDRDAAGARRRLSTPGPPGRPGPLPAGVVRERRRGSAAQRPCCGSRPCSKIRSATSRPRWPCAGGSSSCRLRRRVPPAPSKACSSSPGDTRELASLLDRERRRLGDETPEARRLDLRRGRLLLDALGDCEGAAAIFSALHEREPENEEILTLLERALRAGHDAAGLCELLARRASWETRAIARAPFDLERAQILEEVLGQPHEACDVYEGIAQAVPDSAAGLARAHTPRSVMRSDRAMAATAATARGPRRVPAGHRSAHPCASASPRSAATSSRIPPAVPRSSRPSPRRIPSASPSGSSSRISTCASSNGPRNGCAWPTPSSRASRPRAASSRCASRSAACCSTPRGARTARPPATRSTTTSARSSSIRATPRRRRS